ncbi:MAG: hypothetical protein H7Z77_07055 [Chitinophagaceae bacterium]|nr:hypothetical protein [Polaromonas sp.]
MTDSACTKDQQIALLWQALEKLSKNGSAGNNCVPADPALACAFEAEKLNRLMSK